MVKDYNEWWIYILTLIASIKSLKEINEKQERGWGFAVTNIFISIILILISFYLKVTAN